MHWIKNGPDVEKPGGDVVIRFGPCSFWFGSWAFDKVQGRWRWLYGDQCDTELWCEDADVTHFAVITEPEASDGPRPVG